MSLAWDITDVENYKTFCFSESTEAGADGEPLFELNSTTERLIWLTIPIGMGEITKKNCLEFATRVLMYEAVSNASTRLTVNDVREHIGLKTNVLKDSRSKFMHTMERVVEMSEDRKESTIKEIEEEA